MAIKRLKLNYLYCNNKNYIPIIFITKLTYVCNTFCMLFEVPESHAQNMNTFYRCP